MEELCYLWLAWTNVNFVFKRSQAMIQPLHINKATRKDNPSEMRDLGPTACLPTLQPLPLHNTGLCTVVYMKLPLRTCSLDEKDMEIYLYCHMNQSNDLAISAAAAV
ncbi:hypothetical protein Pcinc_043087 [Petrolisthes cinctipes]|uniref:Uncharacterized protein n=1 Tax=Petrolisthes cinctipes TaxID=88211 RepID=A0AAE1BG80_PETCI|nr:hypothetical protein Pcinc_043087 [Petrolisthes cinctipes]